MKKYILAIPLIFVLFSCNSDIANSDDLKADNPEQLDFVGVGIDFIDVRSPDEFNNEHIIGAKNIPVDTLKEQAPKMLKDKSQPIAVYCNKGINAKKAKTILQSMGYKNVKNAGAIGSLKSKLKTEKSS